MDAKTKSIVYGLCALLVLVLCLFGWHYHDINGRMERTESELNRAREYQSNVDVKLDGLSKRADSIKSEADSIRKESGELRKELNSVIELSDSLEARNRRSQEGEQRSAELIKRSQQILREAEQRNQTGNRGP